MMKLAWIYDIHQVAAQMSLYLLHINVPWYDGQQGWRSGENTRGVLPSPQVLIFRAVGSRPSIR